MITINSIPLHRSASMLSEIASPSHLESDELKVSYCLNLVIDLIIPM